MGTWASNVNQTAQTAGFLERYIAYTGMMPIYTASSYDAVYLIKKAIEATDSLDKDDICEWIEDLNNAQVTSVGRIGYYPLWDGVTPGPGLNATQVASIYAAGWYNSACNLSMPPYTTHDLIFGLRTDPTDPTTGWLTGIAIQWLNITTPQQVGIWPKAGYDLPYGPSLLRPQNWVTWNFLCLNWSNAMEYPGTQDATIPAEYKTVWAGWQYP